jgi:hypothetical protein
VYLANTALPALVEEVASLTCHKITVDCCVVRVALTAAAVSGCRLPHVKFPHERPRIEKRKWRRTMPRELDFSGDGRADFVV